MTRCAQCDHDSPAGARFYRRTGKDPQAREHLMAATTLYRVMGMTYWLEKAEREMKELG